MLSISTKQPRSIIALVTVILFILSSFSWAGTKAYAGKEGVYVADSSYYTLEDITLSSGTDTQTARFTLRLTNGSGQVIDTNRFGAQIIDSTGAGYSAKLNEKATARVWPNKYQDYKMVSSIPLGVSLSELKVMIFEWDKSSASFMKQIGALSAANATLTSEASATQANITINEVDTTLPKDATLSFNLGGTYKIYKDGYWYLYMNLTAENKGTSSFKLPAGLLYTVSNEDGLEFEASTVSGQERNLLPKEPMELTLSAMVPANFSTNGFSLDFSKKEQTETKLLSSISLGGTEKFGKLNEASTIIDSLKATTTALYSRSDSDGLHLQAVVEVSNEGSGIEALPDLTAFYQFGEEGAAVSSADTSSHPAYLSPKQKTSYHFSAVLPSGVEAGSIQFVLASKKSVNAQSTGNGTNGTTTEKVTQLVPLYLMDLTGKIVDNGQIAPVGEPYNIGDPIKFEAGTVSNSDLEVTLVELNGLVNEDAGYSSVIGKFIYRNKGKGAVAMPALSTELVSPDGYAYAGSRQAGAPAQLMPNTSYAVAFAYQLPISDEQSDLVLRFIDSSKVAISAHQVKLQEQADDKVMSLYPFKVEIQSYSNYWIFNRGDSSYNIRLNMDLDVKKEEGIIVDQNFSKLTFEVVDGVNRTMASQTLVFVGAQKVISGTTNLTFTNLKSNQMDSNLVVKVFETIETSAGPAKRLLKVLELD